MEKKTFTEELISFLISGNMRTSKGPAATESGLIVLTSTKTAPVYASYGRASDMASALTSAMEQNEPLRAVLTAAVVYYAARFPDDPMISGIKDFME